MRAVESAMLAMMMRYGIGGGEGGIVLGRWCSVDTVDWPRASEEALPSSARVLAMRHSLRLEYGWISKCL